MDNKEKLSFLVLHGFGGSPFEVEPLVNMLKEDGFKNIICPTLPGHCKDIDAFKKTGFKDWALEAKKGF